MIDDMTTFLREQGYTHVRQMKNGEWVGTTKQLYSIALFVGLDEIGYRVRYCYHRKDLVHVILALIEYEGVGDPSGPWIKRKGEGDEVLGPGAKE